MDRNTFTGLFLILIILVGSTYLMKPSDEEMKREKYVQDSISRVKANPSAAKQPAGKTAGVPVPAVDSNLLRGPFGSARTGTSQTVVLENDDLKVTIDSRGGRITSVLLKNFKTYDQDSLVMFRENESKFGLTFSAGNTTINTSELYFSPSTQSLKVAKADSGSVTMRLNYGPDQYLDYVYSLKGEGFKVGLTIVANGIQNVVNAHQPINLNWAATLRQKEKDIEGEHKYSGAYYYLSNDQEVEHIGTTESEKKEIGEDGPIKWISFKQHFFSNVLIFDQGFSKGSINVETAIQPGVVKSFSASVVLPFKNEQVNSFPMQFYFGPNRFTTLKAQGYDLEKQIDLGWGPLKWINRVVVIPVFSFLEKFNWSYGLIILVLTILLKVVLSPLTYKSYLSMAKMKVLKPEMDEIKAKVGEDNPTLLQQEYLKLYRKAGVNPLGGCIPMLLQMPIVMAFFFFFPNLFELRGESFLWMEDLSTYDSFINFGFSIPFLGSHISLMCLLMTISTLVYTYFNNQISGATGQMKYIGYITPIIFFGVLNSYPAGLNYYYFLANMLTFGQQYLIRQLVNDEKIHARIQENKKKPESEKKKSKFQQRMEEYMRQQQAQGKKPNK
ncbi:membrane protein insertase YidC [Pedobacter sp. SYSU D00535]|uniref:membrane protein insertase YidC n=1 Tax=Pedobacter sp. SYSU D00535 TaxID=2810308 RepID=UPI001A9790D4|nr:membrane protein insertase YidC [Pedobacter sp. SYSU D00535]